MKQEVFEKILLSLYPNKKIIIKEYMSHERYEFDEDMGFIPSQPSIFVGIQVDDAIESTNLDSDSTLDIERAINKFTSNDFNIYNI